MLSENIFSELLFGIAQIVGLIITVMIGVLAIQKVPGTAGKLIGVAVVLKFISTFAGYFIRYFLMSSNGFNGVAHYFTLNSIFSTVGHLLFLIGIFLLIKDHLTNNREESI